jgi:hypothetical protein
MFNLFKKYRVQIISYSNLTYGFVIHYNCPLWNRWYEYASIKSYESKREAAKAARRVYKQTLSKFKD